MGQIPRSIERISSFICHCCHCKVVRLPTHHSDDGAVYTCQMTLAGMTQQCNLTLNVTCTYYFARISLNLVVLAVLQLIRHIGGQKTDDNDYFKCEFC